MVKIALANEIKNGFEEKDKKEKENLKIKVFFCCKKYFWELTQNCSFLFELKMYFKPCSNLIWFAFEFSFENEIGKKLKVGKWKLTLSLYSACWPKAISRSPPTLSHPRGPLLAGPA